MEIKIIKSEKNELEVEFGGADTSIPMLLVSRLNEDKGVEFAGFKKDHPIVGHPRVLLKTKKKDAAELLLEKLDELKTEVETLKKEFKGKA
jgi:DNA-directed RNA polymerase subunit L